MQRATLSHSRQHHGSTQGIGYVRPRRVVSRVPSPTPESPLPTTNPISSVPSYMSAVRTCECSEQRFRTCDCSELLLLLLLLLLQSRVTSDSCACVMAPLIFLVTVFVFGIQDIVLCCCECRIRNHAFATIPHSHVLAAAPMRCPRHSHLYLATRMRCTSLSHVLSAAIVLCCCECRICNRDMCPN